MVCLLKMIKQKHMSHESGFSLVELLAAMLVITIIIAAFTPLLTTSIIRIYEAGYRSQAIVEAQSETESRLHEDDVVDYYYLEFIIEGENDVGVQSALIEVEKEVSEKHAELTALAPYIPTITLEPSVIVEGFKEYDNADPLNVVGHGTKFSASTELSSITGDDGVTLVGVVSNLIVEERESQEEPDRAKFNLKSGLTNANSPYIIEMKTGDEVVKARLQVYLPYYISVGQTAQAIVSADSEGWFLRTSNDMPITANLNSIIWGGSEYIAVGDTGKIVVLRNREAWESISSGTSESLNCIIMGPDKYVAVGNNGVVITSSRVASWESQVSGINKNLNSLCWGNNKYIIVGDDGTLLHSGDAVTWSQIEHEVVPDILSEVNIYDVAWVEGGQLGGNSIEGRFIAVGSDGHIIRIDSDGENIVVLENENEQNFMSIAVAENLVVIVGSDDTILLSTDYGDSWVVVTNGNSEVGTLKDVIYVEGQFIAVSANGNVITSSQGDEWVINSNGSSLILNSITSRY